MPELKNQKIMNTLYNNGFVSSSATSWEGTPETWKQGGSWWDKIKTKTVDIAQISAGAISEQNAKTAIALRMMDNFLKDNGIKSKISEDIVNNWNAYEATVQKT